jgi:hypothetical protein
MLRLKSKRSEVRRLARFRFSVMMLKFSPKELLAIFLM